MIIKTPYLAKVQLMETIFLVAHETSVDTGQLLMVNLDSLENNVVIHLTLWNSVDSLLKNAMN